MVRHRIYFQQVLSNFLILAIFFPVQQVYAEGSLEFDPVLDTEMSGAAIYAVSQSFIQPGGGRLYDSRNFKIPAGIRSRAGAGYILITGESGRLGKDSVA